MNNCHYFDSRPTVTNNVICKRSLKAVKLSCVMKILFICQANVTRSQMAQALAHVYFPKFYQIESAGFEPGHTIHPLLKECLKDLNLDLSRNKPKSLSDLGENYFKDLDYAVFLMQNPPPFIFSNQTKIINWPTDDPSFKKGPIALKQLYFKKLRDELCQKMLELKKILIKP